MPVDDGAVLRGCMVGFLELGGMGSTWMTRHAPHL
jgi:hypothetical protein